MLQRRVPLVRRELRSDKARVSVGLLAIGAAVALILLLMGLRRGTAEQVSIYVDRQAPLFVAQRGTRNFLGADSVVPDSVAGALRRLRGVESVTPVAEQFAMMRIGGQRVLTLLIGYDASRGGGPWRLAEGSEPRAADEIVVDEVLAREHGLTRGSSLEYRGSIFTVSGLSRGTAGWMMPLVFARRDAVTALSDRAHTSTFLLVQPGPQAEERIVAAEIERVNDSLTVVSRDEIAANDRDLFVGAFSGPLLAMVAIAFVVGVIVIGLTVYGSTIERTREHATLKALGMTPQRLLRLVAVQALVLGVVGSAVGGLLAWIVARAVNDLTPKYLIAIDPGDVAVVAGAGLVMALAGGLLPTRHVAGIAPDSALRR